MSCNPIYKGKKYKDEEEVIKAILQDIEKAKKEIESINTEIGSLQEEPIITGVDEKLRSSSFENTDIKPGVQELFEANLELANSVYGVLGFNKNIIPDFKEESFEENDFRFASISKKHGVRLNANQKITIDNFLEYITNSSEQKKLVTALMEELYDISLNDFRNLIKTDEDAKLFILLHEQAHIDNADLDNNSLRGLDKLDFKILKIEARANQNAYLNLKKYKEFTPTSQQKQEAQQAYSNYLDTVFPDSKVKDIVYHGSNEEFDTTKNKSKEYNGLIYFTNNYLEAKHYAKEADRISLTEYGGNQIISFALLNIKTLQDNHKDFRKELTIGFDGTKSVYEFLGYGDTQNINGIDSIYYAVKDIKQIHILGSKQDIKGFKEFTQQSSTNSKEGVAELFESNPTLANAVYEALGFENNTVQLNDYIVNIDGKKTFKNGDYTYSIVKSGKYEDRILFVKKEGLNKNVNYFSLDLDIKDDFIRNTGLKSLKSIVSYSDKNLRNELLDNVAIALNSVGISELEFNINKEIENSKLDKILFNRLNNKITEKEYLDFLYKENLTPSKLEYFEKTKKLFLELKDITDKTDRLKTELQKDKVVIKFTNTNQIIPQQKQEAQQKFQEYVNVTNKQDIQGFKEFVTNNIYKQEQVSQPEIDNVLEEFANDLTNRFNIPFELVNEKEAVQANSNYNGEPAFYNPSNKTAYLVKGKANKTSAIHEIFTHPFLLQIEKTNPKLYANLLKEAKSNKDVVDYVNRVYGNKEDSANLSQKVLDHEYIARAVDLYVQDELDQQKDKGLIARIKELFAELSDYLKKLFNIPEVFSNSISPNITLRQLTQFAMYGEGKMNLNVSQEEVDKTLKSVNILTNLNSKQQQEFNKLRKGNITIEQLVNNIQIPKEQKQLVIDSYNEGNKTPEELTMDIASKMSYSVEINTAKENSKLPQQPHPMDGEKSFIVDGDKYSLISDVEFDEDGATNITKAFKNDKEISIEEYLKGKQLAADKGINTAHYSNLTVPGGTNYSENRIITPQIVPSIKGHANFAENEDIGWFRSDDKIDNGDDVVDDRFEEEPYFDIEQGWAAQGRGTITTIGGELTKTRRVLELQSDLFQKGRDKDNLTNGELQEDIYEKDGKYYFYDRYAGQFGEQDTYEITKEKYDKLKLGKNTVNQFLQLLNKDNNWVTFFIKSIIQDSAKKGYEKVLFPKGETAAKIEGHETIAEEIIKIDESIKDIKFSKDDYYDKTVYSVVEINKVNSPYANDSDLGKIILADKSYSNGKIWGVNIPNSLSNVEIYKTREEAQKEVNKRGTIREFELTKLEQKKQDLKSQGVEKLKPIEAFYEIKVGNILEKQFGKDNVKTITDEYGNQWREITINWARDLQDILLQKSEVDRSIGQANIKEQQINKETKINELQTRKKELQDFLNLTKSSTGLSSNRDPNGIKYFTDNPDLHGPIWKDGKLQHAKVFLPHTVLKSIQGADKMSGAELKEILGDSLTGIIGYRIPNQGLSSIDALEIMGILPASYGDMIMTYTEVTKKTGSDFDVDKMFVMMPNLKYNKYTNKVEKVKYLKGTDEESIKERYYQHYKSKILKDKYEEINSKLEELNIGTSERIEEAKKIRNTVREAYGKESEQYENAVENLSELYAEYRSFKDIILDYLEQDETIPSLEEFSQLPIHKQNSKKALQNHLLTLYTNILSSENTFEEYITPLDDDSIKYDCNIVAYIEAVSPGKEFLEKSEEEKYKIASDYFKGEGDLRFYTEEHQIETKVRNVAGKAGTGQTSNHLTSHPLFQIAEVAIKQDLGLGEVTKLDRKTTLDNERLINQILSLELNAFVDNAKDPFISLVNFNTYTSNAAFYLLRAGVDFRIVNRLLSQPIVKDLVANNNLLNSKVIETGYATIPDITVSLDGIDTVKRKGKKTATSLTLAKYKINNDIALTLDEISRADLKLSDLTEDKLNILLNIPKVDRNSDTYKRNQLKLLALFLKVRKGGSLLNDVIKATKSDTKGAGTSFAESIALKDLQSKLKEEGLVINFNKLFEKTTLGAYNKNSLELADTIYRSKLITSTPGFKSILATVYNAVGKDPNYLIDAEFNSFVAKAYYRYISSGIPMFRISSEEKEKLFTGLGKKVTTLQSKTDNLFIKELDIKSVPNSYTFIGMESGKISNTEINNMLTSSWLEALESDNKELREVAIDLIKYAYFSSGFKKTINSFYELIPMAYMNNVKNDNFKIQYENVLQDLQLPITDYIFVDQLIRHNPTDSNLTTSIKDLPFKIVKGTNNIMFEASNIPENIRTYKDLDSHTETNYVMYLKHFRDSKSLLYRFNHVDSFGNVFYKRIGLLGLEGAEISRKQDKIVEYNYQGKAISFIDKYKEVDFETESMYKHLPKRNFSFLEQVIDETSFKYKGLQVNGKDVIFKMEETVDGIKVTVENSVGNKIEVGLPIEEHGGYSTFTKTRFVTTEYLNQNGVESIMNALNLPC